MLHINRHLTIPAHEIEMHAVRSQGAGGQNVNKVSSAIHLRFDIYASSLPELYKARLLQLQDQRITTDGVIVIKAQDSRSQEQNKAAALQRLAELIKTVTVTRKKRRPTKPSKAAKRKRMDKKTLHGKVKSLRKRVKYSEHD